MIYRPLRLLASIVLLTGLTIMRAPAASAVKSEITPNASWSDWEDLGGTILDSPAAVSWGPNRIDTFARGTNNHLYHKWYG